MSKISSSRKNENLSESESSEGLRLNKLISDTGMCSRRQADAFIEAGRVTINGTKAKVGQKVFFSDEVRVDGRVIQEKEDEIYLLLNKPIGIVCTTDRNDPNNILDYMLYPKRIFPVGRLDKDSEGLLLLTNNGDIVNKILRAGNNHQKEYHVTVNKPLTDEFIQKMSAGVPILGVITKKCEVKKLSEFQFSITLIQGLNRQIRRMCEFLGYDVIQLKRIRLMSLIDSKLKVGDWRDLTDEEVKQLKKVIQFSNSEDKKKSSSTTANKNKSRNERAVHNQLKSSSERKDRNSSNPMKKGNSTSKKDSSKRGNKKNSKRI